MTTFILTADKCKFESDRGVRFFTMMIDFKPPVARKTVEVKTCDDLQRAMEALRDEVIASGYPTSFYVSETLPRGQRAPNGYRLRRFKIEVDRDTAPVVVATGSRGEVELTGLEGIATDRPGDHAAMFAAETGCDYGTALRMCNMD